MIRTFGGLGLALGLLAVSGCGRSTPPPTVHEAMSQVIAPQAQVLWDISNRATDDSGNPDPSKLSATDWTRIGEAGQKVKESALKLAKARKVTVAAEGVKLQDEGGPQAAGAKQVQGFVDKDPAAFTEHARKLAGAADDFVTASKTKDAKKLFEVAGNLDQVCEACHTQFWYPQTAAAK